MAGTLPIDVQIAFGLQRAYIASRNEQDLNALLGELQHIAAVLTNSICHKKALALSEERRHEVSNDAAMDIIGRYLKNPEYRIRTSFLSIVYPQCMRYLFDEKVNRFDLNVSEVDITELPIEHAEPEIKDTFDDYPKGRSALDVILHDEPRGPLIVVDIYLAKTKQEALIKISKYKGKRWVIDNVKLVLHLYKRLRRPKGGKKWLLQTARSGKPPSTQM